MPTQRFDDKRDVGDQDGPGGRPALELFLLVGAGVFLGGIATATAVILGARHGIFSDTTDPQRPPIIALDSDGASGVRTTQAYTDVDIAAMTPENFFLLDLATRVRYAAPKIEAGRSTVYTDLQSYIAGHPDEIAVMNSSRPLSKAEYSDSQVSASIEEAFLVATSLADKDPSSVGDAEKLTSAIFDHQHVNFDRALTYTKQAAQSGYGPKLYINKVSSNYPRIHGGSFMGVDLGSDEARIMTVEDTRSHQVSAMLARLVNAGTSNEEWVGVGGYDIDNPVLAQALTALASK